MVGGHGGHGQPAGGLGCGGRDPRGVDRQGTAAVEEAGVDVTVAGQRRVDGPRRPGAGARARRRAPRCRPRPRRRGRGPGGRRAPPPAPPPSTTVTPAPRPWRACARSRRPAARRRSPGARAPAERTRGATEFLPVPTSQSTPTGASTSFRVHGPHLGVGDQAGPAGEPLVVEAPAEPSGDAHAQVRPYDGSGARSVRLAGRSGRRHRSPSGSIDLRATQASAKGRAVALAVAASTTAGVHRTRPPPRP
jgi:hypothetical protein